VQGTLDFNFALVLDVNGVEVGHVPEHAHHSLLVGLLQALTPLGRENEQASAEQL
jgi:hypothetical protein